MDIAFSLNEKDAYEHYKGKLSVKCCTFKNFSVGIIGGNDSILTIEQSAIINCR